MTAPGEIDLTEAADQPAEPIFVPYTELSEGALRGVLESTQAAMKRAVR